MSLRVIHAGFQRDPAGRSPRALLDAWPTLTHVARAAQQAGVQTTVLQTHELREHHRFNDVDVFFTPDVLGATAEQNPDLVHVHGLRFAAPTYRLCRRYRTLPVVVQDHGGGLPARWREPLLRWGLSRIHAALFTAQEQARGYDRVLPRQARVFEVLESSCSFTPGDRAEARRVTGLFGDPAVLWIGRLDRNKDPLTALEAIRLAAPSLPGLQFWCCYGNDELLPAVRQRVADDAILRERVHLLGAVPHATVEQLCRAADFFISTSHAESSGYALIEALACGLTPILTDIPSFRTITGRGQVGAVVPIGDARSAANALVRLAHQPMDILRARATAHFRDQLTFDAIGLQLRRAYEETVG